MYSTVNIILDLFFIICSCAFFIALVFSKGKQTEASKVLIVTFALQIIVLVFDELIVTRFVTYYIDNLLYILVFAKYLIYLLTPVLFCQYIYLLNTYQKAKKSIKILCIVCSCIAALALAFLCIDTNIIKINSYYFSIGSHNVYFMLALVIIWMFCSIVTLYCQNENDNHLYTLVCFTNIASLVLQYYNGSYYGIYVYGSTIAMFLAFFKLRSDRTAKFIQQEKELSIAQNELMLSQIRPHFLYNALSAIGDLCTIDPEKASKSIDDFAFYLRGNIDSINNNDKVSFKDELQHINYYIELCKLRFGDKVKAEYDIKCDDFLVPTLSLEPFVENAIEHGLKKKKNGGTVKISTYQKEKMYYIIIEDDGVGFDANSANLDNTKSHIGVKNATERIQLISFGKVEIKSVVNKGTKVTITMKGN